MNFQDKSDRELVGDNDIGARGLGAQLEMMRRLKDKIEKLDESTNRWSKILTALTIVLFVVAVFQLVIPILLDNLSLKDIIILLAAIIFIIYVMKSTFRELGIKK